MPSAPVRLTPIAIVVAGLLGGTATMAQTLTIPSGNRGSYVNVVTGPAGGPGQGDGSHPQAGQPAPLPAPLSVELQSGAFLKDGGSGPTLAIGIVGGQGGQGNDTNGGNHNASPASTVTGGDGGAGASPSQVTLKLDYYTQVTSSTTATSAVSVQNNGGQGGAAGSYPDTYGISGTPGNGGNGGTVHVDLAGSIVSTNGWSGQTAGTTALAINSIGGDGGPILDNNANQGTARQAVDATTGHPGGNGGSGGKINISLTSAGITSQGAGITALSQGGNGGTGSSADVDTNDGATGGAGGAAGNGGAVSATLGSGNVNNPANYQITAVGAPTPATGTTVQLPDGQTVQTSYSAAAVQLQSFGGSGGAGGAVDGGKAGSGGVAGSAGAVSALISDLNISTTGYSAAAVLAQSIGGSGGDGSPAGGTFRSKTGSGGAGGNAGSVSVNVFDSNGTVPASQSIIRTAQDDSSGIVAQSIGGGGGSGGDVATGSPLAGVAIGGKGEQGGNGSIVSVNNGDGVDAAGKPNAGVIITTQGQRSSGITAMSVGGGGGSGGNAQSTVFGPFSYTVGGTSGQGGSAGTPGTMQVSVANAGIIQTTGDHAKGVEALAVGGGGGSGGSASSLTASAQINISMAVGGNGGTGGNAGDVGVTNDGQIVTQGNDAFGLQALSVGGGGGNGGASKAAGYQLVSSSEAPSLNFTGSVGGKGAGGGNGGNVNVTNNFSIMTGGVGSHGIDAQSIGGGGGNGGDSTGVQQNAKGSTVNINLTLGGSGGVGGSGATVAVTNNGLIWTQDWFSYGVLAQSIGGGGGNGGVGNSDTGNFRNNGSTSGAFALSAGGDGGTGNIGGSVTVTNNAGVMTRGDLSRGIFAQSVGGGGGNAGGATANGSSGTLSSTIAIGGTGGSGNVGGQVQVKNNGSVLTGGADSAAIYAQSVGGGGGSGGAAAVGGGTNPAKSVADYLQTSVGISSEVQNFHGGIVGWANDAKTGYGVITKLKGLYDDYKGNNINAPLPQEGQGGGNLTMKLSIGSGISGPGGRGANGGLVNVDNAGTIVTYGPASEGIFAQSVGGGGGDGGALSASKNTTTNPKKVTATLNIGGTGGGSGSGGPVLVVNTGTIETSGDQSHGVFAQSIGGGGGSGGITSSTPTGGQDVNIQLGGNAGMSGAGGNVIVLSVPPAQSTVAPSILTSGDDAVGIAAQSVGGGGGLAALMGTTTNADTGGAVSDSTATHFVATGFAMAGQTEVQVCAGSGAAYNTATCGNGGSVTVDATNVQTSGRNAHGVLAQSIGGGGGWVVGAGFTGTSYFKQSQPTVGDGGPVSVTVYGNVATSGDGAYGVLAQSIGGSGLLGGDLAAAGNFGIKDFTPVAWTQVSHGNGGDVSVTVNQGASVATQGANAHAIFAQSVGGGGGLVASDGLGHFGSAGGVGTAGKIDVEVNGNVSATGSGSSAIYVNTAGNQTGALPVTVNVGSTGSVTSASDSGSTIVIDSNAASNTVSNAGVIRGTNAMRAVLAATNPVTLNNTAGGLLYGAVDLKGGSMTNAGSWYLPQGNISVANTITNTGSIVMGDGLQAAAPIVHSSVIQGQLNTTGTIKTSVDFSNKQASVLFVDGGAQLSGTLLVNPITMAANSVNVISVPNNLDVDALAVHDASNYLYTYSLGNDGQGNLSVKPQAGFMSAALKAGLSANAVAVANHLEANFNAGAPLLGSTFGALSRVTDPSTYQAALRSLGNESTQTVGAARLAASQAFVDRMNSCPQVEDTGMLQLRERECVWGRAIDSRTHASGDDAYTQRDQGVQLGGQRRIGDGWFLGGSLAYGSNSLNTASGVASVNGNTASVGVVLKREWNNWLFSGAIDAGHGGYDANRSIAVAGLTANSQSKFGANHAGLHARIAYNVALSDWYVKPYVDLHAVHIRTGSYSESYAAGLGLNVASSSNTTYSATPMLEAGARWTLGNGMVLRPYAAIGRAFHSNNDWSSSSQLTGANLSVAPMSIGFDAPRQFTRAKAGLNLAITKSSELRIEYSGDFARGYRIREGSLRYSYFF